jgi:hypothetical protein
VHLLFLYVSFWFYLFDTPDTAAFGQMVVLHGYVDQGLQGTIPRQRVDRKWIMIQAIFALASLHDTQSI